MSLMIGFFVDFYVVILDDKVSIRHSRHIVYCKYEILGILGIFELPNV